MKRPRALQAEGTLVVLKSRGEQAWEVSRVAENERREAHETFGRERKKKQKTTTTISLHPTCYLPPEAKGHPSLLSFPDPEKWWWWWGVISEKDWLNRSPPDGDGGNFTGYVRKPLRMRGKERQEKSSSRPQFTRPSFPPPLKAELSRRWDRGGGYKGVHPPSPPFPIPLGQPRELGSACAVCTRSKCVGEPCQEQVPRRGKQNSRGTAL